MFQNSRQNLIGWPLVYDFHLPWLFPDFSLISPWLLPKLSLTSETFPRLGILEKKSEIIRLNIRNGKTFISDNLFKFLDLSLAFLSSPQISWLIPDYFRPCSLSLIFPSFPGWIYLHDFQWKLRATFPWFCAYWASLFLESFKTELVLRLTTTVRDFCE